MVENRKIILLNACDTIFRANAKSIRNKQDQLTQFITIEKTKPNPNQDIIQEAHQRLKDIDNCKISRSIIHSKEKNNSKATKTQEIFL